MNNKNNSIPELLKNLYRGGFFVRGKDLSEISAGLATNGHNFPASSLSFALIRAVRAGGFLSRAKGSDKKWKYVQKHPTTYGSGQGIKLFSRYDFHPRIKAVAYKQLKDGYFKEAIQNALVEVIDQVKIKTGYPKNATGRDLDVDDLMNHIFGCDSQTPKIKFNSLKTSLDKAEQRGLMNLFKGVVGVRDRKAHLNFIQKDPLKTIEYLSLASLLMRLLDENIPAAPN